MNMPIQLHFVDWFIISFYFLILLIVGVILSKTKDINQYTIHRGNAGFGILLGSSLSTLVGAGTVFTMFEMGYLRGFMVVGIGLAFSSGLFLTAAISDKIKQKQRELNLRTLPDFLRYRYSARSAIIAGVLNFVAFLFFAAAQFVAVGTLIQQITGIGHGIAFLGIGIVVVLYTMAGGLRSDFVTDAIQFGIMTLVLVSIYLFIFGSFGTVPIWSALSDGKIGSHTSLMDFFYIIGAFLLLAPSFPVAMDVWQRVLAAKNDVVAKRFLIWSGIVIMLFFFGFGMFGMAFSGQPLNGLSTTQFATNKMFDLASIVDTRWGISFGKSLLIVGFLAVMQSTLGSMLLISSVTLGNDLIPGFKNLKERLQLNLSSSLSENLVIS